MRFLPAKVVVFIAMVLALNHARCAADCIANPCNQAQPASCHHHKTPETKAVRGCAFPAANDGQKAASAQVASGHWPVASTELSAGPGLTSFWPPLWAERPLVADSSGGPSVTILRI